MAKQLWLNDEWRSTKASVEAFLRTHHRWITLLGAAIVFAMFVVKDGYRESVKEMSLSIAQAENGYTTSSALDKIQANLASLHRLVLLGRNKEGAGDNINNDIEQTTYIQDTCYEIWVEVGSLQAILEHTPNNNSDWDNSLRSIYNKCVDEQNRLLKLQEEHTRTDNDEVDRVWRLGEEIEKLKSQILSSAEIARQQEEKKVRLATMASYVLYPLGWLVGLLGRLYGGGELETE
jgi:hypothetical protein